jgi:hypothetical protein
VGKKEVLQVNVVDRIREKTHVANIDMAHGFKWCNDYWIRIMPDPYLIDRSKHSPIDWVLAVSLTRGKIMQFNIMTEVERLGESILVT